MQFLLYRVMNKLFSLKVCISEETIRLVIYQSIPCTRCSIDSTKCWDGKVMERSSLIEDTLCLCNKVKDSRILDSGNILQNFPQYCCKYQNKLHFLTSFNDCSIPFPPWSGSLPPDVDCKGDPLTYVLFSELPLLLAERFLSL